MSKVLVAQQTRSSRRQHQRDSREIARGNARVRGVEGTLSLGQVHGNLTVEGAQGGLTAGHLESDQALL